LKWGRGKFNNLIHNSNVMRTQGNMHGRRVFIIRYSLFAFFLIVSFFIRPAVVLAGGWADT